MNCKFLFAVIAMLVCIGDASSQTLPAPKVRPAVDAIMDAFQTHAIVGMHNNEGADNHDLAQQHDFYAALVRDPRFARDVGNVVVEFGAASAQGIMDRYVNGENVPYTELRKVWTDTLGWSPPPVNLGYVNLFAQVRATNLALPPAQRIHVWLGEPAIDWSKVRSLDDLNALRAPGGTMMQLRDESAAGIIEREVLAKGHKALVIYGGFHFLTDPVLTGGRTTMATLIEKKYPAAIYHVETYTGIGKDACNAEFEKTMKDAKAPVLLAPLSGTTLDALSFSARCFAGQFSFPPTMPAAQQAEMIDHAKRWQSDAMLYLGPVASLTGSPFLPDIYMDGDYLNEVMRRQQLGGRKVTPSDLGITVEKNPATPAPFKP